MSDTYLYWESNATRTLNCFALRNARLQHNHFISPNARCDEITAGAFDPYFAAR
jgi:hypothetical protein